MTMTRATCLVCRREVWAWRGSLYDLVDNLARGGPAHFLATHPCWCDDEEDFECFLVRSGDLQ